MRILLIIWFLVVMSQVAGAASFDAEDQFLYPGYSSSKIFMDFKEAALTDILKIFSKQSHMNFVASPEVANRRVTLYLNGVGFSDALKEILDANDLTSEAKPESNIFIVKAKPKQEQQKRITKVYTLKYATVSTSKLNTMITPSAASGTSSGTFTPSTTAAPSATSAATSRGLQEAVRASLSKVGRLIEDPRTNSLIITDIPEQFDIIEKTIADLDVAVPQILIEVQMIDVSKSLADQIGVSYGANLLSFTGASKAVNYPFSKSHATATSITGATGSAGVTTRGAFTPGIFSATGMTAVLNFLSTKTDARTLARPRILTLNNETARIEISTNQAISVQQTLTTSATGGTAVSGNTIERVTTGVILRVTPQANLATREITLAVSPRVINVILSQVQPVGGTSSQVFDPVTTGSDSILKLEDGQTMVIGGLMTTNVTNTLTKLPFLGDLPFIGRFCRNTNKQTQNRELIIFLTPHILDENNQTVLQPQDQFSLQKSQVNQGVKRMEDVDQALNNLESKRR